MLIRMSYWATKPGMDDVSTRLWEERIRAVWHAQPGLVQAHLLAEPGTNRRMTFSVWRSEEEYEAFRAGPALRAIAEAYDEIYAGGHRPTPQEWHVLTGDWAEPTH